MPSKPSLQAWAKTVGPSPSICSLKRSPRPALASILRSVAFAHFQWITPRVVAIELDQVEGVEEYAPVSTLVTDQLERGHAVVIASHRFPIDDARARAQARQRLDDQ